MVELEGGERSALVARPGLVDPDVERDALLVGEVDRRGGRAQVDGGEPAGVAMGEHVDGGPQWLAGGDALDQGEAVAADAVIDRDVLLADFGGARVGRRDPFAARPVAHRRHDLVERPFQVDRGRARRHQKAIRELKRLVGGIILQRKAHSVRRDRPDQRRAAGLHRGNGMGGIGKRDEPQGRECVGQPGLVDDPDGPAVGLEPDAAPVFSVDQHGTLVPGVAPQKTPIRSRKCDGAPASYPPVI